MPRTWKEAKHFIPQLKELGKKIKKTEIYRRPLKRFESDNNEYYSLYEGNYKTEKGYQLYWFYSTSKNKCDKKSREVRINKIEHSLENLKFKMNKYNLKEEVDIQRKIDNILKKYKGVELFTVEIIKIDHEITKQIGKGRKGKNTQTETIIKKTFELNIIKNKHEILKEENVDGAFPILVAGGKIGAKAALMAYKNQPHLEKKFSYLKSVHDIAPIYLNNVIELNL